MKSLKEIVEDTRVQGKIERSLLGKEILMGYVRLRSGKQNTLTVVADDKDGWEHVSVSVFQSNTKMLTWEEMCEVKEIFWRPDEEVHQIHPKESDYVHGVGAKKNVMHLWRPVGGWMEEENREVKQSDVLAIKHIKKKFCKKTESGCRECPFYIDVEEGVDCAALIVKDGLLRKTENKEG